MSAYIVDREHIRYLVSAAVGRETFRYSSEGKSIPITTQDQDALTAAGQMLWDENIKSIQALYPDCQKSLENAPGPIGETYIYSHNGIRGNFDPVQVIKAAKCYSYQSCEHEGWEASAAKSFINNLIDKEIHALPGYDKAAWGAPRRAVNI